MLVQEFVQNIIARVNDFFKIESKKQVLFLHEVSNWLNEKGQELRQKNDLTSLAVQSAKGLLKNKQELTLYLDKAEAEDDLFMFLGEGLMNDFFSQARIILSRIQMRKGMRIEDLTDIIESIEEDLGDLFLALVNVQKKVAQASLSEEQKQKVEKSTAKFGELVLSLKKIIDVYTEKMESSSWNSIRQLRRTKEGLEKTVAKDEELKEKEEFLESRLRRVREQIEEKGLELLKVKDSSEYQYLANSKNEEKKYQKRLEELEDQMFVYLARLKESLSELLDFNSNYELLDVMKKVSTFQEELRALFAIEKLQELTQSLAWVQEQISLGNLNEKAGSEYPFTKAHFDFREGTMKELMDEYEKTRIALQILPQKKLESTTQFKLDDLEYRRGHFRNQEQMILSNLKNIKLALEKNAVLRLQRKKVFEDLAKNTFGQEVEISFLKPPEGQDLDLQSA